MLVYVFSSCCRPGCSRLLHLLFQVSCDWWRAGHVTAVLPVIGCCTSCCRRWAGCLGLGLASSWELDTRTQSHLVTMHSWTGAAAAGLVILQVNTLQSATFPRMYI